MASPPTAGWARSPKSIVVVGQDRLDVVDVVTAEEREVVVAEPLFAVTIGRSPRLRVLPEGSLEAHDRDSFVYHNPG